MQTPISIFAAYENQGFNNSRMNVCYQQTVSKHKRTFTRKKTYLCFKQRRIQTERWGGSDFSNILVVKSHCGFSVLHNTAVTKLLTAKWPYIANAVFRIVKNHGE